jgi:hypothetical protein
MKITIDHLIDKNGNISVNDLRKFLKEKIDFLESHPINNNRYATASVYDAKDFIKQTFFKTWNKKIKRFEDL